MVYLIAYKLGADARSTGDYAKINKVMREEGGVRVGTRAAWLLVSRRRNGRETYARIKLKLKSANISANKITIMVASVGGIIKERIAL